MPGMTYSPLTSSQTQVFVGEKGKAWRFFVEATAVRGRPTLIRKIIKNGGSVVNSAREADILLAENNTKEALELFEAWRSDKILLSTRWVARCLEAHTLLGSDRGWGGCEFTREVLLQGIVVSDDGSDAEEEEVSQNPRPSRLPPPSSQASKTSSSKSLSEPGPSRLHTSNTASPKQSRNLSSKAEQVIEQKPLKFSAITHNFTPQSSGTGPLHTPQNSTLPMDTSPQASFSSTQTTLQQQQQAFFATMFGNLIQPSQQPPSPDMFTSLGQYSNFPQTSPLLTPSLQQIFAQQLAANPLALQPRLTELAEQPGLGRTGPQLPGFGVPSGSTQEFSTRPTPEVVDTDLVSDAASVRSEEGEVELSVSRRRGGKGRAMSDSSSDQVQTAVRSNLPRSKENAPRKPTGIFVDGQGIPQQFYVMVDIKNRKDLLKIIRKHNGAIVSQMKDADFIILNNRSNQFQKALDLLPNHKIAISPTWLEECESMGKMADKAPHVIDVMSGVGRGASRRKPTSVNARLSVPEECKSEDDASGRIGKPETSNKVLPTANSQGEKITTPRARSQSPSPPTNIVPASQGNLFTEEDRIWFFKYARFKLERDPCMSQTALIGAIAHKAPHHTVRSWSNTVRTRWWDEMETLKREIVTLYGQTSKALPSPSSSTTPQDAQNELMYPETSPIPMPSQSDLGLPSSSSQAESTWATPLKRKEPIKDQVGVAAMNQQNKKLKTTQDDVIDVGPYLDGWVMPV